MAVEGGFKKEVFFLLVDFLTLTPDDVLGRILQRVFRTLRIAFARNRISRIHRRRIRGSQNRKNGRNHQSFLLPGKDLTNIFAGGGSRGLHSTVDSILASRPAVPGSILGVPKIFFRDKFSHGKILDLSTACTA